MPTGMLEFSALLVAVLALRRAYRDHRVCKAELDEMQKRVFQAERLLRLRGNLATEIAHEIKNPISAILCSAETLDLLIGNEIAAEHRLSLRYIKEYGDNLLQLVSDFLDVSMAESGQLRARPEPLAVQSSVSSVIGLLDSHAIRKKLRLQQLNAEDELFVYVDPKHFKQIIFNLIHNAIRFTPEGGEVQVVVKSDFPNPYVLVDVRDNGVGIPPEELPRLFDMYARYEGNQPKFGTGLGLGLSLCKTLTEYAGGSIRVTSSVNIGTSFEVRMPLHVPAETEANSRQPKVIPETPQPLEGQSFLLIDDDTGSRDAVARLIQAWGGMVNAVSGAADAVQALGEQEYDAVMIESTLAGGSGEEIARIIREEVDLKDTTLILSADSDDAQQRARQAGADKCITKPYNGKVLLASLIKSGKYSVPH